MTRILFFPDDHLFLVSDTHTSPEETAAQIRAGCACGPIPAGDWTVLLAGPRVVVLPASPSPAPLDAACLSSREKQVLLGLAEGMNIKQIGRRMGVQRRTVFLHIARLKAKLGASTREQCVARAAALGLFPPPAL